MLDNPPQHLKGDFILSNGLAYTFEQEQLGEALTHSGIAVLHPRRLLVWKMVSGLCTLLKQATQQQQVSAEKMVRFGGMGTPERLQTT